MTLEEMQAWAPSHPTQRLRALLAIFQFRGEEVFKRVEVLSGGEKNRLALARLTLDPGNFLLLDEPTNHLDLPAREALEDALAGFGGALLFVSHDRYFINRVATGVAAFREGRLMSFPGGFDDYLGAIRSETSVENAGVRSVVTRPKPAVRGRERRRLDAEARNRKNRILRAQRQQVAALEEKILPFEKRLKEIESELSRSETYQEPGRARRLGEEKKSIEIELAHLYDKWDGVTAVLEREETSSS